ncbi:succinate dehydrogenase hydrophobic membrane anchor subunit [Candidatus Photodesmus blepharus]|uniref:Succinate dehydrogenase hydrophobic membrane anchor subunit n=1 Tax=Candidatus Photodesmus blepharonis TaxID=1179155 RepID=A0A084CN04_9GAMM|nr:succinate dehydrogenase, hydrophobic membrane anchor protein [Candidatus Photodesmus blepharus]KEY91183.1 succinate dehydrogenase hydrophobic membrane anchor subunit [Candidatus Photodesmus blepharus]
MVGNIFSFGRNGVHDFLLIRAAAVVIAVYFLYILGFFLISPTVSYESWKHFFSSLFTEVFTMLALVSILIHVWIGLWQVLTDYIKCSKLRCCLQLGAVLTLLGYFFSGLFILWSV